jgi:hypothetical protein
MPLKIGFGHSIYTFQAKHRITIDHIIAASRAHIGKQQVKQ